MTDSSACQLQLNRTYTNVDQHNSMHATLIRRQLGGLIPPKIATPKLVVRFLPSLSTHHFHLIFPASRVDPVLGWDLVVDFYSKLPKGQASPYARGFKGRYFNGNNASGVPIVGLIAGLFLLGYTIDYNSE